MPVRFQADANLNQMILLACVRREPSVDFQTATAAGLMGLADELVLDRAASEGRVLVTHDHRTMPRHFSAYIAKHTSAGLVIVSQSLPIVEAANELLMIHGATEAEEWVDRIVFLPL
jgi:hypothetical protein